MAGYMRIGDGRFRLIWPPWQPPPGDGVVAMVREPCSTRASVDALLVRKHSLRYVWTSTEINCETSQHRQRSRELGGDHGSRGC